MFSVKYCENEPICGFVTTSGISFSIGNCWPVNEALDKLAAEPPKPNWSNYFLEVTTQEGLVGAKSLTAFY